MRERRPGVAVGRYGEAFAAVPWDGEYAFRAGKAAAAAGDMQGAMAWLNRAIAADPMEVEFYLMRGQIEMQQAGETKSAKRDCDRALALNPNDVGVRVGYGDWLVRMGEKGKAREEYQMALEKNGQLDLAEPKRLSKQEMGRIEGVIESLK
jgi:tetratricopeptide (TPR) repeat protein